ncbi:flippase [Janthinobacterium sp. PLB04]|uniref:Flippase n=1 Tax=Janthinobacterium lividum TaxID=29581 RepID=A0AAJ4T5K3_9BURK|nr:MULTISPECIES: flippase [Janthinobacterium]KAB0327132.1 flippase [Janthinobacterium lividum]QSX96272.1 flippase [Janthinobacterium lividum]UGQ36144.1 flippase [Janthinobacterium sp. PLB04]
MFLKYAGSKVAKDILKVLSGNVVAQGLSFLAIIIISRDLGPESYGDFALIIAIFTFLTQISDFGTSTSYVKFLSENKSEEKVIFSSVLIFKTLTGILFSAVIWFFSFDISGYFFSTERYEYYFRLAAIALVFHSVLGTVIAHFQGLEKFRQYSLVSISHYAIRFLAIVVVILAFAAGKRFEYFIYIYFFAVVIVSLSSVYILQAGFLFKWKYVEEIYKLGFWIFFSSVAVVVMMRIDVVMLKKLGDAEAVGFYSVASNVAMILPLITMSITATLMPKMEAFLRESTIREFIKKILKKTKYVILVSLLLQAASPLIIYILFGEAYLKSIPVLLVLVVSYMFGVIVNPISLIYYQIKKPFLLTAVNWGQLLIGYSLNLLLIPDFGAVGAAISSLGIHIFSSSIIVGYLYFSKVRDFSLKEKPL